MDCLESIREKGPGKMVPGMQRGWGPVPPSKRWCEATLPPGLSGVAGVKL